MSKSNPPAISVVVPAYNEAGRIADCLASLRDEAATVPLEIIVVDNGSTDSTAELARAQADQCLVLPGHTVGALRNAGVAAARADVIAFIDADCTVRPGWASAVLCSLELGACVTGAKCGVPDQSSWMERVWFGHGQRGRTPASYVNSGNMAVRRDDFAAIGGFDATLTSGEDYEFCQRAAVRGPIISDDRIGVVHHGNPKRVREFYRRERWHGLGALASFRNDPRDLPLIATLTFGSSAMIALAAVIAWGMGHASPVFVIILLMVPVLVCILSATYRITQGATIRQVPPLAALYCVYFIARCHALLRVWLSTLGLRRPTAGWKRGT
jgi:glycosyltransferase involved in cell wall biosynthesis